MRRREERRGKKRRGEKRKREDGEEDMEGMVGEERIVLIRSAAR